MKSIWFKKRLEKNLSYPKLTAKANRRFDEILSRLPEREESVQKAEPAHFAKAKTKKRRYREEPAEEEILYLDMTPRRSWPGIAVRAVACLVALCVMLLAALNSFLPDVAETLPGLGGFFQAWNHRGESPELPPDSSVIPSEEREASLSVEDAYTQSGYLFLSLRLDAPEEKLQGIEWLSTGYSRMESAFDDTAAVTLGEQELYLYKDLVLERKGDHFEGLLTAVLPEGAEETAGRGVLELRQLYAMDGDDRSIPTGPAFTFVRKLRASFFAENRWPADSPGTGFTIGGMSYQTMTGQCFLSMTCPIVEGLELTAVVLDESMEPRQTFGEGDPEFYTYVQEQEGRKYAELIFSCETGPGRYLAFLGDLENSTVLLGEFWLDLEKETCVPIEDLWELNPLNVQEKMGLEEYGARLQLGLPYCGHVYLCPDLSITDEGEKGVYSATATIYSDVDANLPVEAELLIDGTPVQRIPLALTGSAESTGDGFLMTGEGYELDVFSTADPATAKRTYVLTFYFPEDAYPDGFVQLELKSALSEDSLGSIANYLPVGNAHLPSEWSPPSPTPTPGRADENDVSSSPNSTSEEGKGTESVVSSGVDDGPADRPPLSSASMPPEE